MKNILVPMPENHPVATVLDCTLAFGKIFGSCIEGLALAPDLSRTIAAEFPIEPYYIDPEHRRALVVDAHAAFQRHMEAAHVAKFDPHGNTVGHDWRHWELGEDSRVGSYGRLFDLIAVNRPTSSRNGPQVATVETALFESGRPVLLVPPVPVRTIGRRVVIAWNGSTETARTVAFAMPILLQAEKVLVLALEGWTTDGPSAAELTRRLERHGIATELVSRAMTGAPGEAILTHARDLEADLIVKGAYTQSRLRQMIFGGATSYLLSHTDLPMFIAH